MSLLIFFIYIFLQTQDGALTEPEQTRNDRHKMRAYNEVLDKQPTSKTSKNGNSKFSHENDHYMRINFVIFHCWG